MIWSLEHPGDGDPAKATSPYFSAATPSELYAQTGGGDAYRVAMLEAGYVIPTAPWERKAEPGSGRALQCGLTHDFNWSPWQQISSSLGDYEARWCRTCATTQAHEVEQSA